MQWTETHVSEILEIHIGEIIIKSGDWEILAVKIDSKLDFWWSCTKAKRKLRALAPVTP